MEESSRPSVRHGRLGQSGRDDWPVSPPQDGTNTPASNSVVEDEY